MPEKFFSTPSLDPAFNLALEEVLLDSGVDGILLWRSIPAVLTGAHQVPEAEVQLEKARLSAIPVLRRTTGGGTVFVDPGTLNFSIFTTQKIWSPERAQTLLFPILNTLRKLHWACTLSGRNDILCSGRKISGCARRNHKGRMLLHGTLLYDTDLDKLSELLTPSPVKLRSKGIASVRARVGNLRDMTGPEAPNMEDFCREMAKGIYPQEPELPAQPQLDAAEKLAESRYRNREWNFGTPFPCTFSRSAHFAGGNITAEMEVRNHRIRAVRFTGDFFAEHPLTELVQALIGVPPEYEAVLAALKIVNADSFITGISGTELAGLLAPEKER